MTSIFIAIALLALAVLALSVDRQKDRKFDDATTPDNSTTAPADKLPDHDQTAEH